MVAVRHGSPPRRWLLIIVLVGSAQGHAVVEWDVSQSDRIDEEGVDVTKAEEFLAALGGDQNVVDLEPCITRLRVEVTDPGLVNEDGLRSHGAFGVVRSGRVVQVVVGPEADDLAAEIDGLRSGA